MPKKQWYIGCSGFYYKEWKEIFYPKGLAQKSWFEYYCTQFNTLEINNTFYRFPQLKNLEGWQKRSPDDFVFSVKVPGAITHYKQFRETETLMKDFYSVVKFGLGKKMGPVLFQLPPKFSYSENNLAVVLSHIDHAFLNVIEFRNETWWREDVIKTLKEHNTVFCSVSFPGLSDKVIVNNPLAYYRFHGVPHLFYSTYEDEFLKKVVEEISQSKSVKQVFLYFNNTASAAALSNAKFVQQLTGSGKIH